MTTMRASRAGWALALSAAIAAGGCSSSALVDYQLTGGLAGVDTRVHIEADGDMTRTRKGGRTDSLVLDTATIDDLERKIDAADFPTLDASYQASAADDFLYTITVHATSKSYTVQVSSAADYPARLKQVIDALDAIERLPRAQD